MIVSPLFAEDTLKIGRNKIECAKSRKNISNKFFKTMTKLRFPRILNRITV